MTRVTPGPTLNQLGLKRAILELTRRCNLACAHCSREAGQPEPAEMDTALWLKIVEQLIDYGTDILVLGGGEPFLEEARLRAIMKRAISRGTLSRITTNGLLLHDGLASFIYDNGGVVCFGMDGMDEKVHDSFRGLKGAYRQLMKSIDLAMKREILDLVAVTATKSNFDQIPKVIDFAAQLGVTCIVSKYVPTGRPNYDQLLLSATQRREVLELVGDKRREHPHIQITTTREPLEAIYYGTGAMRLLGCIAGTGWCLISATGDVQPCPYLPVVVGNVCERPFGAIWELSPHLRALRDRSRLKGKCGACPDKENCGGCRALAFAMTDDYLAADPQCWLTLDNGDAPSDERPGFLVRRQVQSRSNGTSQGKSSCTKV